MFRSFWLASQHTSAAMTERPPTPSTPLPEKRFSVFLNANFVNPDEVKVKALDLGVVSAVVRRLWFFFVVIFLTVVMFAIVGPLFQYVILSFFAARYGVGSDCMATPDSRPCRLAAGDMTTYNSLVGALVSAVSVVSALTLGSLSDSIGRRSIFLVKGVLSCAMLFCLALHQLLGLTLWMFLVVKPLAAMWDFNGVSMALLADVIPERDMRGAAMSITIALVLVVVLVCIGLSALLPVKVSFVVAMVAATAKLLFYFTLFPETMKGAASPEARRRQGPVGALRAALLTVSRNSFILRMAVVAVIGGISSVGTGLVVQPYLTSYIGMQRQDMAALFAVIIFSVILTLGVLAKPLTSLGGDVRTYQASLFVVSLLPAILCVCSEPWHVMVALGLTMGPVTLQIPIISAIKSNLVNDAEQGLIQGALAALVNAASTVASPLFGWLYNACTEGGAAPSRTAAFLPLLVASATGLLAFLVSLSLPPEVPKPGSSEQPQQGLPLLAEDGA
eukprot:TRINITY_DN73433_c0_g1_i1.p1 TRINITY_DN73433_c0_g1~~TRINITY_DN73433_c0_g1_i1.p1  ORF type:complete len:504 (+),score=105.87 TRINITY_DN73433_c0_g1_i1:147-1658(+)